MREVANNYQICNHCVMDTTDSEIVFDSDGICNYCKSMRDSIKAYNFSKEESQKLIAGIVKNIKKAQGKNKYDSVLGISGGVDSSYLAYISSELGLNPLVVHVNNGWNNERAERNIENIVKRLGFDLKTHVIDWEEFRDIQHSYLKASVINLEATSDHAIIAGIYKIALKYNIKYILNGRNINTEGILPTSWGYNNLDLRNLKAITSRFGTKRIKTMPTINLYKFFIAKYIKGIKEVSLLNYVSYNRLQAIKTLIDKVNWIEYGGKHYESIITRFYQGWILPQKFGVDKRKAHFSSLICSGQIKREEAIEELKNNPYPDPDLLKDDMEYVIKKFGLTEDEFKKIISLPIKSHYDFANNSWIFNLFRIIGIRKSKSIIPLR